VPQWRALITGETSTAEQFGRQVLDYLKLRNTLVGVLPIQAASNIFGELPVLKVALADCYLLLDCTNGNLSGPFDLASPFDARGLLSLHPSAYQANSSVRYYAQSGCPTSMAPACVQPPTSPGGACGVGQTYCTNAPNQNWLSCLFNCVGTPPNTDWNGGTSCANGCASPPLPRPPGWQPGCAP